MENNCNHIFNLVNPGINIPSYGKCIYCGQIGDDAVRIEHLPTLNKLNFDNDDSFKEYRSPGWRFNCARKIVFDDPTYAEFLGHELNHK